MGGHSVLLGPSIGCGPITISRLENSLNGEYRSSEFIITQALLGVPALRLSLMIRKLTAAVSSLSIPSSSLLATGFSRLGEIM